MFLFRKDKLYKVVYQPHFPNTANHVLMVVAKDLVGATRKFYDIVGFNVSNIVEIVEIEVPKEGETK